MNEESKQILIGFLIGSVNILRDNNIKFTEKSRNKLADKIELLLDLYEKEKKKYNDMINCCNELMKQITELQSDIQQKDFEIGCLNSDIKNMYCEEGVISILEDEFDLSREEAIEILENY